MQGALNEEGDPPAQRAPQVANDAAPLPDPVPNPDLEMIRNALNLDPNENVDDLLRE